VGARLLFAYSGLRFADLPAHKGAHRQARRTRDAGGRAHGNLLPCEYHRHRARRSAASITAATGRSLRRRLGDGRSWPAFDSRHRHRPRGRRLLRRVRSGVRGVRLRRTERRRAVDRLCPAISAVPADEPLTMPATRDQDPVHGYVELEQPLVDSILDAVSQRLRHHQLSATNTSSTGRQPHALQALWASTTSRAPSSGTSANSSTSTRTPRAPGTRRLQRTLECAALSTSTPPFSHLGRQFLDVDDLRTRLADHGLRERSSARASGTYHPRGERPPELLGCLLVCREYGDALGEMGVDHARLRASWATASSTSARRPLAAQRRRQCYARPSTSTARRYITPGQPDDRRGRPQLRHRPHGQSYHF